MFGLERLHLDSHDLVVIFVEGVVDLAERASSDLLDDFVVLANDELHSHSYKRLKIIIR